MADHPFASTFSLPAATAADRPSWLSTTLCPTDQPLLRLPVRLETRFFPQPDGSSELRIRVYPDKIHIDSHEPALTTTERDWGQHFWEQTWRAGDDTTAQADAWRQLAVRFGANRAAWIVRVLQPVNAADRPHAPTAADQPLATSPQFANVAIDPGDSAWRHPPQARLLPDHWVAILYSGGNPVLSMRGEDIRVPLAVGPDPRAPQPTTADDELAIDAGMTWMVDFEAAESVGMGLRVLIPAAVLMAGIDSVYVIGAAAAADPEKTSVALRNLLDAHHYTDGLSFLRLGAPSNNNGERRSEYGLDDVGYAHSFATEVLADIASLDATSNAVQTGQALSLPSASIGAVLGRLEYASDSHELGSRNMNTGLWEAS